MSLGLQGRVPRYKLFYNSILVTYYILGCLQKKNMDSIKHSFSMILFDDFIKIIPYGVSLLRPVTPY